MPGAGHSQRFDATSRPILILGGTGMLGGALQRLLTGQAIAFTAPNRRELDLLDLEELPGLLKAVRPSAVINAAAYTDVAGAQRLDQRDAVYRLNRDAVEVLGRVCRTLGVPLAHVSTDYVFDGAASRPYREDDPTHPLQVYGQSKLDGELALQQAYAEALIVRTSTLYGPGERKRPHYVDAIRRQAESQPEIQVVKLPVSGPTYAPDLAEGIVRLLNSGADGIVHWTNQGACSRMELAQATVELVGKGESVEVVERPAPEGGLARPDYSALDLGRYTEWTGVVPRPWRDALEEYLQ